MCDAPEDPSQVRYTSKTTPWLLDELFVLVTGQKAGWYAGSKTRSAKFSLLDRVDRMETRLTHLENTSGVPPNPNTAPAPVPLPPLVSMLGFKDYFITASELDGTSSDSDKNDKVSTANTTPVEFSGTSAASKTTKATSISLGGTSQSPKPQPKSNLGGHKRPANAIDNSPTPAARPIKKVKIVEEPKAVFKPWNDTVIESDSEDSDDDEPSRATKTTSAKKPKKAAENQDQGAEDPGRP
ncbi:hypothetical protein F5X68DRAFT_279527 [Plectosphaerella plurivora]|uniref:Uncharacterized protein n=1 Tax=Plectosphaerella plurivora TaxID=936078 RepID=A0A9P9A721_9PEZI|nr:hypothetical protein F5X68DRAFT_279527 [Plectosphaerella plurivora]